MAVEYIITIASPSVALPVITITGPGGSAGGGGGGAVDSVNGHTGVVVLTKSDLSLGSVDNTADSAKPVSTAQQTALNLKANLSGPAFTGVPTAPTAANGNNTTQIATTAFIQSAIALLVNSSPGALDTLNELAAALGNDANFATTITNALALKAPLASPALTGSPTAPTQTSGDNSTKIATTAFVAAAVSSGGITIDATPTDGSANAVQSNGVFDALALKQDSDSDLTAIAGLSATNDDFIQRKSGAWANRTVAQVKSDLSVNNVDNTSDSTKNSAAVTLTNKTISGSANTISNIPDSALSANVPIMTAGKISSTNLPAYVDDVLEYANLAALPATGTTGIIYITLDTNLAYRWTGAAYQKIADGAVTSVAGRTGVVTLTADDTPDGTTNKAYTATEKTKLAAISGTNTGDETTATIKTKLGISTLSGSNTGDQDLSGYATKTGAETLTNKTLTDPIVGTQAAGNNSTKAASTAYVDSADALAKLETICIAIGDETTAITTGTAKVTFRMPYAFTLVKVKASLTTVSSSGNPAFDINEGGVSILSTTLTIDASEKTSKTAATAAVISDSTLADDAEITIDIDTAGTGATGAKIYLIGYATAQPA